LHDHDREFVPTDARPILLTHP